MIGTDFCVNKLHMSRSYLNHLVFIYFSSLRVSGIHAPIIRKKLLYLCDTGTCHTVWVASGLQVGFSIHHIELLIMDAFDIRNM